MKAKNNWKIIKAPNATQFDSLNSTIVVKDVVLVQRLVTSGMIYKLVLFEN